MHQIRFRLRLRLTPSWGSLQRSPRAPQLDFRGLLLREGREEVGEGRARERGEVWGRDERGGAGEGGGELIHGGAGRERTRRP